MKKLIRNLEKNNAYDSDEERNPYASSVSLDRSSNLFYPHNHIYRMTKRMRKKSSRSFLPNQQSNNNLNKSLLGLARKRPSPAPLDLRMAPRHLVLRHPFLRLVLEAIP